MKKDSIIRLLTNRDYVLMVTGMFVSRCGTFMQTVAVNWQLYQMTKSPLSLGLLGLATFMPILIGSFISGIAADIYNRKKIIFLVQIFSIANSLALAYLTIMGKITPNLIYLLVGVDSLFYSFESPARQAMTPTLVDRKDFPMAVSINNILYHATNFIGPATAGFIIAFGGVHAVYLINAVSFVFVMIALVLMGPAKRNITKPEFNLKGIREGVEYVFKSPLIYGSMLIDFFATFFASATTLMPIFAVDILGVGPKEMGFLYAAPSVGAILAGLAMTILPDIKEKGKALMYSVIGYGLATIIFGLSKNYYLSLIFIGLTGAADMVSVIIRNVIRQMTTPDHLRGRMVAINMIFYTGGPQLGEIEAGFAAQFMGTPLSVAAGGLATIVATILVVSRIPRLRDYKEVE
ncbi:MAG: MFS transporter [Patescibacteria group bacterium]